MEITQVKIFPVHEEKLKAFVSVVFDHCFMVNDIKVIQGKDGLFLSMPSRRKKSGEFKDVAHPLNNATRRMIEERVLREYRLEAGDLTPRRPDRESEMPDRPMVPPMAAASGEPSSSHAASSHAAASNNGNGRAPKTDVTSPPAAVAPEKSLEEVQELHLSDSFWSVS